eukprot:2717920-Rhodomonas_salina.1
MHEMRAAAAGRRGAVPDQRGGEAGNRGVPAAGRGGRAVCDDDDGAQGAEPAQVPGAGSLWCVGSAAVNDCDAVRRLRCCCGDGCDGLRWAALRLCRAAVNGCDAAAAVFARTAMMMLLTAALERLHFDGCTLTAAIERLR